MLMRLGLVGTVLPALLLAACGNDPEAPSSPSKPDFHVISAKCDFMTGGGFVGAVPNKITFGLHAGRSKDGTVFGHLTVVDHKTDTKYESTHISSYGLAIAPFFVSVPTTGVTRVFEGQVKINNGVIRNFSAYMNDSGEPGKHVDHIYFKVNGVNIISSALSGGLPTMRLLDGGNLQFHNHCLKGDPQSGK
jgi:hypothetical protein